MNIVKGKLTRNVDMMIKAWRKSNATNESKRSKTKRMSNGGRGLAPNGCFSVYVGPEKQRFTVKVEFVNHALFKLLLDDAAWEYGYSNRGPIVLPCDVGLFCNVLAEMEETNVNEDDTRMSKEVCYNRCGIMKGTHDGGYMLLSSSFG